MLLSLTVMARCSSSPENHQQPTTLPAPGTQKLSPLTIGRGKEQVTGSPSGDWNQRFWGTDCVTRLAKKRKACHRRNGRGKEDKEAMVLMTGLISEPIWGSGLSYRPWLRGVSSPSVTGRHLIPTPSLGIPEALDTGPTGMAKRPTHHAALSYSAQTRTNSSKWWGPKMEESRVRYSKLSMMTATNRLSIWKARGRRGVRGNLCRKTGFKANEEFRSLWGHSS